MIGCIVLAVLCILSATVFCIFRAKQANPLSLVLKTLSSVFFVTCGLFAVATVGSSTTNILIIAGLVMGLIGDIILDLKIMYPEQDAQYFVAGTSFFAIGHIFYFTSALLYNISALPTNLLWNILSSLGVAIVLTLLIMLPSKKMGLDFGKMLPVAGGYSIMLTFMVAFSISIAIFIPIFWIFAVGMLLFFLSDLVLSMQYFGGRKEKVLIYVNHFLYYLAQATIAFSILYIIL